MKELTRKVLLITAAALLGFVVFFAGGILVLSPDTEALQGTEPQPAATCPNIGPIMEWPCCLDEWQGGGLCPPWERVASYCEAGCENCGTFFCTSEICFQ